MESYWPPDGAQAELLATLARLIERGGPGHFLDGPVAAADASTFPETWRPTAVGVERLLLRLLWLAYVDLEVELEDLRRADTSDRLLKQSTVEWIETRDGVAHFQIEQIGNDDVAGMLSHQVGRAFAAWIDGAAPYREAAPSPPSVRTGSVAAIYLGLGVLATNAAHYNRVAGKSVGQMAVSETAIVTNGGLSPSEAVYLLAVQAVLRATEVSAHATLRDDLAAQLRDMIAALRPHRDDLARWLGLDLVAPRPALERDPAPRVVAAEARPEPSLRHRHGGLRTYRFDRGRGNGRAALGLILGLAILIVDMVAFGFVTGPLMVAGWLVGATAVGGAIGSREHYDVCVRCAIPAPPAAATCPGCGAEFVGRVKSAGELHERELEQPD